MTANDVIAGRALYSVEQADCLPWLRGLPSDAVDAVITSPPYEAQRLYLERGENLGIARNTDEWVAWMIEICHELRRVCKGLCVLVVEGRTKDYRYSCSPFLLMADLHRAGFHLRKPAIYRRSGIPGSGGPDWWRNDWEPAICFTRGGKLPWSDNTATGKKPKFAVGGDMSNRMQNGQRVNAVGYNPPHRAKKTNGEYREQGGELKRRMESGYSLPEVANPGNIIHAGDEGSDYIDCGAAGGGHMGSDHASDNEAPFPEDLVAPFIRSFCPPNGIVLEPFCGSGTVPSVALKWGRRAVCCDLRQSQCDLTKRRIQAEAIDLFTGMPTQED